MVEKFEGIVLRTLKYNDTLMIADTYAAAYRKVIENYEQLLEKDDDNSQGGRWYGQSNNE